jgi:hypothetical protein
MEVIKVMDASNLDAARRVVHDAVVNVSHRLTAVWNNLRERTSSAIASAM